jgi:hypothetical protein
MTDQTTAGALSADDQSAIEQAHAIRDGSEWFFEKIIQPFAGGLESTAPQLEPSSTPISDKAFNMIVMFEVSSQAAYQAKYQHPICRAAPPASPSGSVTTSAMSRNSCLGRIGKERSRMRSSRRCSRLSGSEVLVPRVSHRACRRLSRCLGRRRSRFTAAK